MKFTTVKSKQTTVSVDLVPPLVLGDKQRISLVDIRIPEQYFEFSKGQAIGTDSSDDDKIKIIHFSKHLGKYNARRLKQVLNGDPLKAELGLEISITDKAAYLETQSKEILFSAELAKNFDIPRILKPFRSLQTPIFDLQEATIMASGVFLNISPTQVTPKHLSNIHPKRQSLKTKEVVLLMGILCLISKTQKRETSMNISFVLSRTASQALV